jgi:2-polyprenyl-3-methyl-5-hydroxy-6-metoxy-1,4-benzoquinol methylase
MAGCCDPRGCDQMFGGGFARRVAKRYRHRGLDDSARRMTDFLSEGGLAGATVLEIGGGIGEIGVELLRRGAAGLTEVELSPAYDEEARRLAEEAGVVDRVRRRIVDIAATPDVVQPADLVVLHRVVCCYPDYERLLGAAADRCRSRFAFSHPPRNAVSRAATWTQGRLFSLMGREFRAYAHSPEAMLGVLRERGLTRVFEDRPLVWHVEGLTR